MSKCTRLVLLWRKRERSVWKMGLTLVEVIIAIAIISIVAVAILSVFGQALQSIFRAGTLNQNAFATVSQVESGILDPSTLPTPSSVNINFYQASDTLFETPVTYSVGMREIDESISVDGQTVQIKSFVP